MYCLEGVVAAEPVLRELAGSVREARIVPLRQHLALLPMTKALCDALAVPGPDLAGFRSAPTGFGSALQACSVHGAVAYVEAEFFGGDGSQSALVWHRGHVVLGPLHLAEGEPMPAAGAPIAQALRQLGVDRADHFDEFDAVGLGRYRETEDWLPPQS